MWTLPLVGEDIKQNQRRQWHSVTLPREHSAVKGRGSRCLLVLRGFPNSNRLGGLCAGRPSIRYFRSAVIGITVSAEARPAESSLKVPFQTLFGIFRDRKRQN